MYFKSVQLENFRNFTSESQTFHSRLNLFLGQNAQGKTNLLESLYVTGLGRSFRTNKDSEMIRFGSDFARVRCELADDRSGRQIEIIFRPDGKIIRVNGIKLEKTADLLENVYIVIFAPDDLKIIKEGPENRRRFLDRELCQIKPLYYSDLGGYKRILKQRNSLLKQKNRDTELFRVFNESLAEYGIRIASERKRFVDKLLLISSSIHSEISEGKEELGVVYQTQVSGDKEEYISSLSSRFEEDLYKGYTSFGPHKDDILITINGNDSRIFASQGQQRTASLSMKLAEIRLIKQETGEYPVLLLDDVLSELDKNRQRFLIESVKETQVFITSTDIDPELYSLLPEGNRYFVDNGNVSLYNL